MSHFRSDKIQIFQEMHRVTLGGVELAVLDARDSVASLLTSIEAVRGLALVLSILSCMAGPRLRLRELDPAPAPLTVGVASNPKRWVPRPSDS